MVSSLVREHRSTWARAQCVWARGKCLNTCPLVGHVACVWTRVHWLRTWQVFGHVFPSVAHVFEFVAVCVASVDLLKVLIEADKHHDKTKDQKGPSS